MKNSNPLERDIEKAVVIYSRKLYCLAYKFTSPSRVSVPDRIFITPKGTVFFMELKRRGEVPTKAQAVEIAKLNMQGARVFVCDSVDDGKRVIDMMVLGDY